VSLTGDLVTVVEVVDGVEDGVVMSGMSTMGRIGEHHAFMRSSKHAYSSKAP
jgi:hypothetical protein